MKNSNRELPRVVIATRNKKKYKAYLLKKTDAGVNLLWIRPLTHGKHEIFVPTGNISGMAVIGKAKLCDVLPPNNKAKLMTHGLNNKSKIKIRSTKTRKKKET